MTTGTELYKELQKKWTDAEERGDRYQQKENYSQALVEYAEALYYFRDSLDTLARLMGYWNSDHFNPGFLFSLATIVKKVISCYVSLKEHKKAGVFAKNLEETLVALRGYRSSLDPNLLDLYEQIVSFSETANLLQNTIKVDASTGKTIAIDNSDPIFNKLSSEFDRCTDSPFHLLPSRSYAASSSSSSSSSCFIATATYSTSIHPDLDTFREFRDEKLIVNPLGKLLVNIYYQISPSIAKNIEKQPAVKNFLRHRLELLAQWMRSQKARKN